MNLLSHSISRPAALLSAFCRLFLLIVICQTALAGNAYAESKKSREVTFNFVDVDLTAVAKFVSEITGKNFIFDDRIKGKITVIAPTKLSIDDAFSLFTAVLELKGFTVVPAGVDAYKIIPAAEAKQRGLQVSTEGMPVNESYMARLIPLKYISSDDALRFLQPLVSRDGHISTFGPGNVVLVVDSGLNIDKILSIVDLIDKPSLTESPEVVTLKHASADAVAKIIADGMGRRRRAPVPGQPALGEGAAAVADQRLNAVILFGDRGEKEAMKLLISLIDVPSPEAQGRINVYFLENADATDLAKVLEGMIRGAQQPVRSPVPGTGAAGSSPFEAAGGITITADKATNSLVIVASPSDYRNIAEIVKQLDHKRKQVFVEAMIVEASMDKLRDMGIQWRASATKNGEPIVIGGFGTIDQTSFQNILQGLTGASVGGLANFLDVPLTSISTDGSVSTNTLTIPGFAALFNLNEFRDTVNVLSTPQILTSDNKEAEILVGENVPFITQSQSSAVTSGSTSIINSIVRQDVGIILRITPHISEGDHVKLDIYQEISFVKNQSDALTISVGPTITKRSTKTSVTVKDNEIVVIGGLMQENTEETVTKMPLLGDIPLLGWIFKSRHVSKNKTNLIVFLNPHIFQDADKLAEITAEKQRAFAAASEEYAPGELLVRFKEGVDAEKAAELIQGMGGTIVKYMEGMGVYQIRLKEGQSVKNAAEAFGRLPEVQYAEPNYRMRLQDGPAK
jgi:general secretion pathway protein D